MPRSTWSLLGETTRLSTRASQSLMGVAQSEWGETVSHSSPSLALIMPLLVSPFALVSALPVRPRSTSCLKCKCGSQLVGQTLDTEVYVCACWPDAARDRKTQIEPLPLSSNRSGRCVAMAAAAKRGLGDKGIRFHGPLVYRWYNNVSLWANVTRKFGRGIKGSLVEKTTASGWRFSHLKCDSTWDRNPSSLWPFRSLQHIFSFLLTVKFSVAKSELQVGQLPTASCRTQAKCWVNTGCVWRLGLLCICLCLFHSLQTQLCWHACSPFYSPCCCFSDLGTFTENISPSLSLLFFPLHLCPSL